MMRKIVVTTAAVLSSLMLTACGSLNMGDYLPDKKVEYKKAQQSGNNLEIPPDLSASTINNDLSTPDSIGSGSATYSDFVNERRLKGEQRTSLGNANVLPTVDNIDVMRDGSQRWLVIHSSPQMVWPAVVNFWQQNGILLVEQDPTVGVMRTGWLENRADIASDFITNTIRRVFDSAYSAATRDSYRLRLEEGEEPGTTELYLTHFGMEEQVITNRVDDPENTIWVPRGTDHGLEAEMLRRLMVHLGVADKKAQSVLAAKAKNRAQRSDLIAGNGKAALRIEESFSRAWRLTGLALDRVGFAVEDRNRSRGIYYVRYKDPTAGQKVEKGWLSSLAFWSGDDDKELPDRYQVLVEPGAEASTVTVLDEDSNPLTNETAVRILTLIHEQIR